MSRNTQNNYIRTLGYVLRRTNYGEADRILNIITPLGKVSAIAKGVRKEKSKLAGGVEMFSLIDFNIYKGRGDFGTVTGAKMIKYYGDILKNYDRMEMAAGFLKKISLASESSDSEEYFNILGQGLVALNSQSDLRLIEAWFLLNLARAGGEEINLYRDVNGEKLEISKSYDWNKEESAFFERGNGEFSADDIKLLRLMVTNDFNIIKKIRVSERAIDKVLYFAKIISRM